MLSGLLFTLAVFLFLTVLVMLASIVVGAGFNLVHWVGVRTGWWRLHP